MFPKSCQTLQTFANKKRYWSFLGFFCWSVYFSPNNVSVDLVLTVTLVGKIEVDSVRTLALTRLAPTRYRVEPLNGSTWNQFKIQPSVYFLY